MELFRGVLRVLGGSSQDGRKWLGWAPKFISHLGHLEGE